MMILLVGGISAQDVNDNKKCVSGNTTFYEIYGTMIYCGEGNICSDGQCIGEVYFNMIEIIKSNQVIL